MKNIFKSLAAFVSGLMLFASCQNEMEPLAQAVTVDKTEVEVAGQNAEAQKVTVKADGAWIAALGADWLVVEPMSGNGNTEVKISAKDNVDSYNELNGPRSSQVSFLYGTSGIASVKVSQLGEAGLDASRTYSLVKKTEDVVAGSYLIVFETEEAHKALTALPETATESRYEYCPVGVVEVKGESITEPNASKSYLFEAVEGGFHVSTAGRYLFQDGSGFKTTLDKTKAHVWSVVIGEDGSAKITNTSYSNQYIQLSTKYGTAGAYSSPQENALVPCLYKDAAAASDEVLTVAKEMTVGLEAVSVSIPVTSNKTWKVRNHDEWIKSFTKSGTGNGSIEVTFDALEAGAEARTATFTVIGETTNAVVVLTQKQLLVEATAAEINAAADADDVQYRLAGYLSKDTGNQYGNIYIKDATGEVYVYGVLTADGVSKQWLTMGISEGDILTVVGPKTSHNGNPQLKNVKVANHIKVTDATVREFLDAAEDASVYYRLTGTAKGIANAGEYGNFNIKDATGEVLVYGLLSGWGGPKKQFQSLGIKEGDTVTLVGVRSAYKGTAQVGNAFYVSHQTPDVE